MKRTYLTAGACAAAGLSALTPAAARAQQTEQTGAPAAPAAPGAAQTVAAGALLRLVVVDARTGAPVPGASVTLGGGARRPAVTLAPDASGAAPLFDAARWAAVPAIGGTAAGRPVTTVRVPAGGAAVVRVAALQAAGANTSPQPARERTPRSTGGPLTQDIYIRVTAPRLDARPPVTSATQVRSSHDLQTFTNATAAGGTQALTKGQSGVASDSNGQAHVRGEHAEISYVIDGVPLPDSLSGRQGAIVVPSTIEDLDILTGSFAPEYGGQAAAVLNINTLPAVTKPTSGATFQGGGYGTFNSQLTASGPIGDPARRAGYVLNVSTTSTDNVQEPQQPDNQTAHNAGHSEAYFAKLRFSPARRDTLTVTVSDSPTFVGLSNRTGLPARYASAGQGYGFLGLRNADGTRPDVTADNADALGAAPVKLPSQQDERQAINERDAGEFGVLTWRHPFAARDLLQFSATVLHSGQTVNSQSPAIDLGNLPVDNSIEYNPDSVRSVYHGQFTGDLTLPRGTHQFKTGLLYDGQRGTESYQLIPASQLALDALAAIAPDLAPAGAVRNDAGGKPVTDVDGNPVYQAAPGAASPTLHVKRSGLYAAYYVQDTWAASHRLTVNYGARVDWYRQTQDLGQPTVDVRRLSPRLNFSYALAPYTPLRLSYDRILNTPPLAQGAVVGQPIQPELVDQYDASVERRLSPGNTVKLAYYYKHIQDQVDTGLLIPGSQIGLYSAVNLQYGGVHGVEFSYDLTPTSGYGWDGFVNYTYSIAKPNGVDNTGAPVPRYNDHDQRHTVGAGLAYDWKGGATVAATVDYGSGLASSPIPPSTSRQPRSEVDVRANTGKQLFGGRGGLGLDVTNLFDRRGVINFQSAFSGTRFQEGRRILLSLTGSF